jgi:hypothetical protein
VWRVERADLLFWNSAPHPVSTRAGTYQWQVKSINAEGQTSMTWMSQGQTHKRLKTFLRPPVEPHPWQAGPPLPFQISGHTYGQKWADVNVASLKEFKDAVGFVKGLEGDNEFSSVAIKDYVKVIILD